MPKALRAGYNGGFMGGRRVWPAGRRRDQPPCTGQQELQREQGSRSYSKLDGPQRCALQLDLSVSIVHSGDAW